MQHSKPTNADAYYAEIYEEVGRRHCDAIEKLRPKPKLEAAAQKRFRDLVEEWPAVGEQGALTKTSRSR